MSECHLITEQNACSNQESLIHIIFKLFLKTKKKQGNARYDIKMKGYKLKIFKLITLDIVELSR